MGLTRMIAREHNDIIGSSPIHPPMPWRVSNCTVHISLHSSMNPLGLRQCLFVILASALIANTLTVDFGQLVTHPRAYHAKHLSVVGFAHVEGEGFVLYENRKAASVFSTSRAISVAQRRNGPSYDRLNNHWVVVTGIVDADHHGLWNFPCELLLDKAEPADGKKHKEGRVGSNLKGVLPKSGGVLIL